MFARRLLIGTAMVLFGCSGESGDATTTASSTSTSPPETLTVETAAPTSLPNEVAVTSPDASDSLPWVVDTADCDDPSAATAPLDEPVRVASLAPTQGLPGAAATPVMHALEVGLAAMAPGTSFTAIADPTDPQARAEAVSAAAADAFVGIVGSEASSTAAEALARRCVPQLFSLGDASRLDDPERSPWTLSAAIPAVVEADAFMADVAAGAAGQGATVRPRVGVFLTIADSADSTEDALRESAATADVDVDLVSRVDPFDGLGILVAANTLVDADLDAVVVASSGLDCISFLQAWTTALPALTEADPIAPTVYLAGACASRAVVRGAADAADGAVSAAVFVDVDDPEVASVPEVAEYLDAMRGAGFAAEASFGVAGWVIAQATAEVLRQAGQAPGGLTRATVIEAARALDIASALLRPGITISTDGVDDAFVFDTVRLVDYVAESDSYVDGAPVAG